MTVEVLKSHDENDKARTEMIRKGIDHTRYSITQRVLRKIGLDKSTIVGEHRKSWDVLKTVQFIENKISPGAPVLDIGVYASEVLCALHRLKYTNLAGVDLNPMIINMPYASRIRYVVSDFKHTPFNNASFDVVTAISVIEHGFDSQSLLTELSRILRPGGFFIASVDYWPDKIDTAGIKAFDMDWIIFSEKDLRCFFEEAVRFGFKPFGEMNYEAEQQAMEWNGRRYTFAWFVLQKVG